MIFLILSIFTALSIFALFLSTPISMTILLMIISLEISLTMPIFFNSSWLSYLIFLMTIGGLLILFIYSASLSPNQKSSPIPYMLMILTVPVISIASIINTPILFSFFPQFSLTLTMTPPFMVFSILYLFMLLFIITMLVSKKSGPLRSL